MNSQSQRGFTLVELLIVVVILGLIAALAVPRFSTASATARASMLADELRIFRMQVEVFKSQHRDAVPPGHPGCDSSQPPTEVAFIAQMTQASDADGATAAPGTPGFRYGPYLREIPENPVNGKSSVEVLAEGVAFPGAADDSHGWIYQPSELNFRADCTGTDESGTEYIDY